MENAQRFARLFQLFRTLAGNRKALVILAGIAAVLAALLLRYSVKHAAREYYSRGNYGAAVLRLKYWLPTGLLDLEARKILMSALLITQSEPGTALALADSCLADDPGELDCIVNYAQALKQLKMYEDAERYLNRVLVNNSGVWILHLKLAEIAAADGKVDMAFAEFQSAAGQTQDDRNKQIALQQLVQMLVSRQRFAEAARFSKDLESLAYRAGSIDGLLVAAQAYAGAKKIPDFKNAMRLATELMMKARDAHYYRHTYSSLFADYGNMMAEAERAQPAQQ